jgi:hypothetical protein
MEEKRKPGRPFGTTKEDNKKAMAFRLASDVRSVIKSKPNQVTYIESLVRKDAKIKKDENK